MKKFLLTILIFSSSFFFGLSRLAPTISGGDSGELAGAGATLGIAHSPGYPLYCLLGRVFTFLFPFGNSAYRMNLMSTFFGSLTCVLVYLIIFSLTQRILPAVVSALILYFTKIFWLQSLVSEVFTLNCFFASFLIFVVLTTNHLSLTTPRSLYLFAFLLGLGLGNHHTLVFLLPGFAYLLYRKLKTENVFSSLNHLTTHLLITFLFFLLGLLVYLYLPIRSLQQPLFDWEDPQTIDRFWGLITRARYGTLQLAQGGGTTLNLDLLLKGTYSFFYILNQILTPLGIVIFFLGLFFLFRKKDLRETGIFLVFLLFFSGPFFFILSGVRTLSPGIKYILERFVTLSLVPTVIILGVGVEWILNRSRALRLGYVMVIGLPVFLFLNNYPAVNQRNNFFFSDYGKNIIRNA
ncbi:MAG TPA: hypothetical protein DHV62_02430, partial [Elusimicrobia bacterium]|nr:hypothetical protein [Elusimicrobiota bacterium]